MMNTHDSSTPPRPPVRYEGVGDRFSTDLVAYVGAVQIGWIRARYRWDIESDLHWSIEAECDSGVNRFTYPTQEEAMDAAKRHIEITWELIWADYFKQPSSTNQAGRGEI